MDEEKKFQPYVPAERSMLEFTFTSIITGVILAVVFGAANAYLGLRVGMTISASIPAAVISMGVLRVFLRRKSILESNLVQTIGSAGESLASGAIFTLPALFLWAGEGKMELPSITEITIIGLIGGTLGVLFMVPLRNALIVREHNTLPYPEGTACAEVLLAAEDGGDNASTVFTGLGMAALFKFLVDGLKIVPSEVSLRVKGFAGEIGTQIYPAVMSVGYICGPRISSYMLAGSVVSWLAFIPAIVLLGANQTLYPGTVPIGQLFAEGGAGAIWSTYIRYIGAGALAAGGIISLVKSLPLIVRTFRDSIKSFGGTANKSGLRTEQDLSMGIILGGILVVTIAMWLVPAVPVSLLGAAIVVVFGFFFAAVSSRMVGIVGSSNNPVSGMAIATLLVATVLLKVTGDTGARGMQSAIAIGSIICIIAAIAGDTSQDLKTGYLLGATPKKQQIGELIGIVAAAFAIGGVLYLLHRAWGFGSEELGAPQAMLMKLIVEGVMDGNLPWSLVLVGVFLAVAVEIVGVPVLPFAIGVYLPIQLNVCIMIGGLVRLMFDKMPMKNGKKRENVVNDGILYCSGMIAGEGLVGILLAVLAVFGVDGAFNIGTRLGLSPIVSSIGSLVVFALVILSLVRFTLWKKNKVGR